MSWLTAIIITAAIVALAFYLSRWMEKKNFEQQQELIKRKKARLQAGANEGDVVAKNDADDQLTTDADNNRDENNSANT